MPSLIRSLGSDPPRGSVGVFDPQANGRRKSTLPPLAVDDSCSTAFGRRTLTEPAPEGRLLDEPRP
eukprot:2064584-Amphidinium_carterae.1